MTEQGEALLAIFGDAIGTGWGAVVAALSLAGATYLFPGVRWQRRLRHDLEVLNGLRDGHVKRDWERRTRRMANRLAEYRLLIPWSHKLLGWSITTLWLFVVGTLVWELLATGKLEGVTLDFPDWLLFAALTPTVLLLGIGLMSGRTIHGWTTHQWRLNQSIVDAESGAKLEQIATRAIAVAKLRRAAERAERRRVRRFRKRWQA